MKYFSLIQGGEIQKATDAKVIPQAEFSELLSAAEIVEKAKEDAALHAEQTAKECEELRAKAKEEGFQEGLETFNKHIVHMEEQMKQLRVELQGMVLPLVLKAAKKVVGETLKIDPQAIVDIVSQTLHQVTQNTQIRIYVNKEDKEIVEKERDKLKSIFERLESFNIEERADVEKGGCVIETETGIINASLENQWRALEAAFEAFMK